MPKYIEGLEEKILECAEKNFIEKSYDKVSMRCIAKELNIAVGTLYNYYSNKTELFFKVFEYSWKKTFSSLEAIINSTEISEIKLKLFIEFLYDEIMRRKGLAREIFKIEGIFSNDNLNEENIRKKHKDIVDTRLIENISNLLIEIENKNNIQIDGKERNKLIMTIISSVFRLSRDYFNEKEENTNFILDLIKAFYNFKIVNEKSEEV